MNTPVPTGYKQSEVGVIPEDWNVKALHEFASIKTGPFGTLLKASEYSTGDGVPLISVGEIREGFLRITDHTPRVSEAVTRRLPQYVLKAGDIVFGRKGGVERSSLIRLSQEGWFLGSDGISVRPARDCHNEYLGLQFQSARVQGWLLQNAIGTTMPSLNQAILRDVAIPIPPTKAEQEAIAGALSDADALIESLEQLVSKKRRLKQGAMQELLTGKKRLPGFSGEWESAQLIDCLRENPAYGINAPAVPYSDKLPPYLRITDISDDGRFSAQSQVSVDNPHAPQYYLSDGDLVFARTGASVGKSYLYNLDDGPLVFAGFLIRVRPNTSLLICSFLAEFVKTDQYWAWVRMTSMRSGQPGINGKELGLLPIPLPSVQEQLAIATILSDMAAEIAELEAQFTKARTIKQGMMNKLLTGKIRLI